MLGLQRGWGRPMKLPRIKLLGRDDDLLIAIVCLLLALGAGAYITTAVTPEIQKRWNQAAAGISGAIGLVLGLPVGRKKARQEGFDEGFWTPNPAIPSDTRDLARDAGLVARGGGSGIAGMVGGAVATGVAAGVSGMVAHHVGNQISSGLDSFIAEDSSKPDPGSATLSQRQLLQRMTLTQLRKLAQDEGKGDPKLASVSKSDLIDRLMEP